LINFPVQFQGMSQSRQLAAIMFTDIAGYTAMMQKDEKLAVDVSMHYIAALKQSVPVHSGQVLNDYGDGSLCIFHSVMDAIHCALQIQKQLQSEPVVPLRIGLHIGEIFFEEGKVFGDGVNVASRIQSLGLANTILFSKEIADKIKNHPEMKMVSLGLFEFKNVEEPMEVFALANEGLDIPKREEMGGKLKEDISKNKKTFLKKWIIAAAVLLLLIAAYFFKDQFTSKTTLTGKEKSIAVLYFDNMSGEADQEYFSDGITEEIIAHLSKIKGIQVISRTSVLPYKGKPHNLKKIGKELNVGAILEGSVRKSGNVFRVTGQLIDALTDKHLWAVTFDRDIKDIFEVQTDIARNIAKKFEIKITPEANAKISQVPTPNIEAYELFQKGKFFMYKRYFNSHQDEDIEKSKKFFEQAIQLDSGYAEAYAGLAEAYDEMRNWDELYSLKNKTPKKFTAALYERKEKLARKALQLKPNSSFVNSAMAWMLMHRPEHNFDSAFFYLKKAFYLDPEDPLNNYNLGTTLSIDIGLDSIALPLLLRAVKGDPLDPNIYVHLGHAHAALGNFAEAKKAFNTCYELTDENFQQEYRLVYWLIYLGELDKAKKRIDLRKGANKWVESYYYAVKGEPDKVNPDFRNTPLILLATNRNKVLKDIIKQLESGVDQGFSDGLYSYDFMAYSPELVAYREDPDFKRMLAKAKKLYEANLQKYGNIEIPE
jgi:adenylate cyclase